MKNRREWARRLMRYGLSGGLAAVVDVGGFSILINCGISLPMSAVVSFLLATVINYVLAASFVFHTKVSSTGYLRFLIFASLGLAANVTLTIFVSSLGITAVISKLIGVAVAFKINFILNAIFVFRRPKGL